MILVIPEWGGEGLQARSGMTSRQTPSGPGGGVFHPTSMIETRRFAPLGGVAVWGDSPHRDWGDSRQFGCAVCG